MIVRVKVKTSAGHDGFRALGLRDFALELKDTKVSGVAASRACSLVARHFNVPASKVRLVSGGMSENMTLDVAL